MNCQRQQAEQIKAQVRQKYKHLSYEEVSECYNNALADYVMRRYPSSNNRPPLEKLSLDFYEMQKVKERMEEIQKNIADQKALAIEKDNGEELSEEIPLDEADQSLDAIEKLSQEANNNDSSK